MDDAAHRDEVARAVAVGERVAERLCRPASRGRRNTRGGGRNLGRHNRGAPVRRYRPGVIQTHAIVGRIRLAGGHPHGAHAMLFML